MDESEWRYDAPDNIRSSLEDHFLDIADTLEGLVDSYEANREERYLNRINELVDLGSAALEAEDYWKDVENKSGTDLLEIQSDKADVVNKKVKIVKEKLSKQDKLDEETEKALEDIRNEAIVDSTLDSEDEEVGLAYAKEKYRRALTRAREIEETQITWPDQLTDWKNIDVDV